MQDEPLACYRELADQVVYVDGSGDLPDGVYRDDADFLVDAYSRWPKEFSWGLIGQQFQRGYEACSGDWVIRMDLDMLFHEKDFSKIKQALADNPDSPAMSFYKWQFILPDRYNLKSRLVIAVNKAKFGDRIKFDSGGDLCQPSLDGKQLSIEEMPQAGVPIYNYEHLLKTKEQIMDDVGRMDRAYKRHFGKWLYSEDGTDGSAYKGWLEMMLGRYKKPSAMIRLVEHPKYIQEKIKNLKPNQFGYNAFGLLGKNDYAKI